MATSPQSPPTSGNIYRLLHMCYNEVAILECFQLASEVPWGTKAAEEIHASAATLRKYHPEIGPDALRLRAFLHTLRRVIPSATKEEKLLKKAEQRLSRVEARCPSRLGPRQMLIQDLFHVVRQWKAEGRCLSQSAHRQAFQKLGTVWDGLSASQFRDLERAAVRHIADKENEKCALVEQYEAEVAELRRKRDRAKIHPGPLLLSSSRWGDADIAAVQAIVNSVDYQLPMCTMQQELVAQAPAGLPDETLKDVQDVKVYRREPAYEKPKWLKAIVACREEMEGSALTFQIGTNEEVTYAFMFARKDDLHSEWRKLEEKEFFQEPAHITSQNWSEHWQSEWARQFEVDCSAMSVSWEKLPRVPVHNMKILHNVEYIGGCLVGTDDCGFDFEQILLGLPEKKQKEGGGAASSTRRAGGRATRPKWLADMIARYPWMEESVEGDEAAAKCRCRQRRRWAS